MCDWQVWGTGTWGTRSAPPTKTRPMERSTQQSTLRWPGGSKVRPEGEELCKADGGLMVSFSSRPIRRRRVTIVCRHITNRHCRIQPRSTDIRCMAGRTHLYRYRSTAVRTPELLHLTSWLSLSLSGLWIALSTTTPSLLRNRKFLSETWLWTSHLLELWSDSPINHDADKYTDQSQARTACPAGEPGPAAQFWHCVCGSNVGHLFRCSEPPLLRTYFPLTSPETPPTMMSHRQWWCHCPVGGCSLTSRAPCPPSRQGRTLLSFDELVSDV